MFYHVDLYTDEGIEDNAQETMLSKITSKHTKTQAELNCAKVKPHMTKLQKLLSTHNMTKVQGLTVFCTNFIKTFGTC